VPYDRDEIGEQILENANRLIEDAEILFSHDRFASAFGLAVLSLEEVGKLLLRLWASDPLMIREKRKYGYHRVKQNVVACLYMANRSVVGIVQYLESQGLDREKSRRGEPLPHELHEVVGNLWDNEEVFEFMAKAIRESKWHNFHQYATAGVLDKTKQCAFYLDEEFLSMDSILSPLNFGRTDANNMIDNARTAIQFAKNNILIHVAKAIYKNSFVTEHETGAAS
jgi:hypothetical protein